jgi:hypothetical protein
MFLLAVAVSSNTPKTTNTNKTSSHKDPFPNLQAVKDTLNKFDDFKRMFYCQDLDYNICIDRFEGKRIGIVSTDNLYILTREDYKEWELLSIDTAFGVKWRDIRLEDINGDGFKDIKTVDGGGPYGSSLTNFLIYNPKTKLFKHNAAFDGSFVRYDLKTNLVQKMWEEPRFADKSRYAVVADTLMLVDNISWGIHEDTIIHKVYKNGKQKSSKTVTQDLPVYFKKTLWLSE